MILSRGLLHPTRFVFSQWVVVFGIPEATDLHSPAAAPPRTQGSRRPPALSSSSSRFLTGKSSGARSGLKNILGLVLHSHRPVLRNRYQQNLLDNLPGLPADHLLMGRNKIPGEKTHLLRSPLTSLDLHPLTAHHTDPDLRQLESLTLFLQRSHRSRNKSLRQWSSPH